MDLEGAEQLNKRLQRQMQSQEIAQLVEIIKNPPKMKDKDSIKFGITILEDARIEFSQRISQILACLLLTLWGIGLGIKPPRTSRTVSYLVGATAGFGFYYLNVFFKALALKKMMSIEIALFSPTILILLSGAWLLQERRHGKEPLGFLYQFDEYVRHLRAEKKNK
jgi:lipopolysaccharide export LptBFGC system permease protein LptF